MNTQTVLQSAHVRAQTINVIDEIHYALWGWCMGLQVASSKAPNAGGKSVVFAVSGVCSGEGAQ
jgi:hypothetical protein